MALSPPSSIAPATVTVTGTVAVSNFPADQLVHGTVTANQGAAGAAAWPVDASGHTVPISAAALPLPAGAASDATLERVNDGVQDVALTALLERDKITP